LVRTCQFIENAKFKYVIRDFIMKGGYNIIRVTTKINQNPLVVVKWVFIKLLRRQSVVLRSARETFTLC
jgi:hypothetical protein